MSDLFTELSEIAAFPYGIGSTSWVEFLDVSSSLRAWLDAQPMREAILIGESGLYKYRLFFQFDMVAVENCKTTIIDFRA